MFFIAGPCKVQEVSWRKTDKKSWKCPHCRKVKVSGESPVSPEESRSFMKSVNVFMASVNEKLDGMEELKRAVKFISEQYDDLINKFKDMEKEREEQRTQIAHLEDTMKKGEADVRALQRRLRDTEQYARNRNVELSGVEVTAGEDLKIIMKNIASKIEVPFHESDVDIIHRLPTRRGEGPPKIVAQFSARTTRNRWLKQKHQGGVIRSDAVVPGGTGSTRVFLNTHLTPEWQRLLWLSKQAGRPKGGFTDSGMEVIGVSETFFKLSSLKTLQNYTVFSADRNHIPASGGAALYVKDCYRTKHLYSSQGTFGQSDYVLVKVLVATVKILCVCVYRPPNAGLFNDFIQILSDHVGNYKYCFVCGDVNGRFGSGESMGINITESFQQLNITLIPFGDTYHIANKYHSSLDIISSNCPDLLMDWLEKIVYDQVIEFVDQRNLISPLQSGFRKGCGTISALLKVTNDIRKAMDKGYHTLLCLLDLSEAFDCLHHDLLLAKLRKMGFSVSVCNWFQSYLADRYFRVYVNEAMCSDWARMITGVPRGPLAETAVTLLSDDINNLLEYFAGHNLMLNIDKTQAQLKRNMPFLPPQIRELLVKSLIFPHIDYALPLLTFFFK
ncbi:hypothetical protein ONE63_011593 [Megalurothrips usitatus]|uniref:Reverse transcriptase domain-containing protein n=1 Tax=Megalurothrips usitatus TaxID=439358 RepID=A0AAV7X551_9NEOP|nr:hypothetical protein ONE63_011593 [Megalurothrips usitatus]